MEELNFYLSMYVYVGCCCFVGKGVIFEMGFCFNCLSCFCDLVNRFGRYFVKYFWSWNNKDMLFLGILVKEIYGILI